MSEDTTKDMSEKYDTKPTIETVLERISEMRAEMLERFKELRVELDVRFDRVESIVSGTRSEFLTLRADFKELRHALGEHLPALNS
ncbi:MAG TPA: hypothetical protein VD861_05880 [Pyrinomonadaceae bacterium]|nr:hypothetical protein [Pyrinomonadaceae bacterium]